MTTMNTIYIAFVLLATIVSGGLAVLAWGRRDRPGLVPFALLLLGTFVWSSAYLVELVSLTLPIKVLAAKIEYIGITMIPPLWFLCILHYSGSNTTFKKYEQALFFLEPSLILIAVMTNEFHQFIWTSHGMEQFGALWIAEFGHGPLFFVHVFYSYLLLLASAILLIRSIVRSPELYQGQFIFLLAGSVLPWVGNFLYVTDLNPLPGLDLTLIGFLFGGIAFSFALFRHRLLDIVPAAHASVLQSIEDPILILDAAGRLIELNPAAKALFSQPVQQMLGNNIAPLLQSMPDLARIWEEKIRTDIEVSVPHQLEKLAYLGRLQTFSTGKGIITGHLIMLRNITERRQHELAIEAQNAQLKQMNQKLIEAQREAEQANQMKSQFLATMSHELRTPLNAINGFVQILLAGMSGELNEKQKANLERTLANGRHLLSLVNNILDLARIEAGSVELVEKPINLREWAHAIVDQSRPLAEQKSLALEIDIRPDVPKVVSGDPQRLQQIIINLLSNGVKFTDAGKVRLEISADSGEHCVFCVSDTGIGIPPYAKDLIFDEFRQVDSGTTRQYGGTGLGLAITRKLVLLMGGTIKVDSEIGKGSTFTVTVPMRAAEPLPLEEV